MKTRWHQAAAWRGCSIAILPIERQLGGGESGVAASGESIRRNGGGHQQSDQRSGIVKNNGIRRSSVSTAEMAYIISIIEIKFRRQSGERQRRRMANGGVMTST